MTGTNWRYCLACILAVPVLASAGQAHVHGQGQLQLVQEGSQLQVELRLPAMDVVGFEHAPGNADQQAAIDQAMARFQDVASVITPVEAAGCELLEQQVESGFDETDTVHHGHNHNHHDHDHHHADPHTDFTARYLWQCATPERLNGLSLGLFEWLPELTLNAELLLPGGARLSRNTAANPQLLLAP